MIKDTTAEKNALTATPAKMRFAVDTFPPLLAIIYTMKRLNNPHKKAKIGIDPYPKRAICLRSKMAIDAPRADPDERPTR